MRFGIDFYFDFYYDLFPVSPCIRLPCTAPHRTAPHRIPSHRTVSNSSRNLAASAEAVSPFSSDRNAARSGADNKSGVKAFGPSAIFSGSILRRRHLSVRNSIHQSGLDYAALVTERERKRGEGRGRENERGVRVHTGGHVCVYVRDGAFRGCRGSEEGPNRGREKLALDGVP